MEATQKGQVQPGTLCLPKHRGWQGHMLPSLVTPNCASCHFLCRTKDTLRERVSETGSCRRHVFCLLHGRWSTETQSKREMRT